MTSFTVTTEPEKKVNSPTAPAGNSTKLQVSAAPWTPGAAFTPSAGTPPSTITAASAPPQAASATGNRVALCPNFMAQGNCMDVNCIYAHSFDELDPNSQMNLITMLANGGMSQGGVPAWATNSAGYRSRHTSHNASGFSAHNTSGSSATVGTLDDDDDKGPTQRRIPGQRLGGNPKPQSAMSAHNLSGSSVNNGGGIAQCPPSPGSHSSDISSVSNASGTDGLTQSSQGAGSANTASLPQQQQQQQSSQQGVVAPGSYGPHTSPFIKSQMYYSQSASKACLPDRCRYPHATPGTYYDYLNVKRSATKADIEKKYLQWRDDGYKKAMAIDQEKADAMDRLIVDARTILCSERMRAEYDLMLPSLSGASQPFRDPAVPSPSSANSPSAAPGPIGKSPTIAPAQQQSEEKPLLNLTPVYGGSMWS